MTHQARFEETETESKCEKLAVGVDSSHGGLEDTPEYHGERDPSGRAEALLISRGSYIPTRTDLEYKI